MRTSCHPIFEVTRKLFRVTSGWQFPLFNETFLWAFHDASTHISSLAGRLLNIYIILIPFLHGPSCHCSWPYKRGKNHHMIKLWIRQDHSVDLLFKQKYIGRCQFKWTGRNAQLYGPFFGTYALTNFPATLSDLQ